MEQVAFAEDYLEEAQGEVEEVSPPPAYDSAVNKRKAQDIAAVTGVSANQVREANSIGDKSFETKTKYDVVASARTPEELVEADLREQRVLQDLQNRYQDRINKQANYVELEDFYIEQAFTLDNPEWNTNLANYVTNQRIIREEFAKGIEEVNGNLAMDILEFIDYGILSFIPRLYEDVTRASETYGEDVLTASLNMSPKEFKKYAESLVAESKEKGLLFENNLWALSVDAANAQNKGYDPNADLVQALGVIGIADLAYIPVRAAVSSLRASTAVQAIQAVSGTGQANKAAVRTLEGFGGQATDDGSIAQVFGPALTDPNKYPLRPSQGPITQKLRENSIVEKLWSMSDRGLFGRTLTEEEINVAAKEISDNVAKRSNGLVLNFDIVRSGPDSYIVKTVIGRNETSLPFEELEDAYKVSKGIDNSRVEDTPDGRGYVVVVEERIDPITAARGAVDTGELPYWGLQNAYNYLFGSAGTRESSLSFSQAALAEQGLGAVRKEIWDPAMKVFKKLGRKESGRLDKVLLEYRDGEAAMLRRRPTDVEVEGQYYKLFGEKPSEKFMQAFHMAADINDAAWWINAQRKMDNAIRTGHTMIELAPNDFTRAYRVQRSRLTADDTIFDIKTGKPIKVKDLKEGQVVYKSVEMKNGYMHFTNTRQTRLIEPEDIHPYNFGGPRSNPEFRFFVGSVKRNVDEGGKEFTGGYKSIFGSFGEAEAKKGATQLNAIGRELLRRVGETGVTDWKLLRGTRVEAEINKIIKANNDWNPHITNLEDLVALSNRTGADFAQTNFYSRGRNSPVTAEEAGFDTSIATFNDILEFKGSGPRNDDVLLSYGGKAAYNEDPLKVISYQFTGSTLGFANKSYSTRAISGWVKQAAQSSEVRFPDGVPANEVFRRFMGAKINPTTEVGKRLEEQRDIIMRRLNLQERGGVAQRLGDMLTEMIYRGSFKTIKADINSGSPTGQLLRVGFYTKMGFFNVGQMVVQAMQMPVIMAMSPQFGFKGASLALSMRTLSALSEEAAELAFQRMAKHFGYSVDELKEMAEYLRTSGRLVVDVEAAELQTGLEFSSGRGLLATGGRLLNKTAGPFREGERLGRLTSEITALMEFKNKFPEMSIKSDFARAWIATRDQDLSFRMTATSRSLGQSGLMRVPTQWLTYTFRSFETLFTGKQFTMQERVAASIPLMLMYGAAGIGMQQYAGWISERLGISPEDDFQFRLVKYGIIDALIGEIGDGSGAGFALRVAPAAQLGETIKKLTEGSFLEAIYGPSGGITADTFGPLYKSLDAVLNGNYNIAGVNFMKSIRSISSINNTIIAQEIIRNGTYTTRSGVRIEGEFGSQEAVLQALGFPPERVLEFYQNKQNIYRSSQEYQTFKKEIEGLFQKALQDIQSDDPAVQKGGYDFLNEIGAVIDHSGFTTTQKRQLRTDLANGIAPQIPQLFKRLVELGYNVEADRMLYLGTKGDN